MMSKIIITHEIDSDLEAIEHVKAVMNNGLISKNDTQYCYITTFSNKIRVYADKTKSGTHTFRVWMVK